MTRDGGAERELSKLTRSVLAVSQVRHTLLLDELWTRYLEQQHRSPGDGEPEHGALVYLADEMAGALEGLPHLVTDLRDYLLEQDEEVVAEALGTVARSSDEAAASIADLVNEDFRGLGSQGGFTLACDYVLEEVGPEIEIVIRKRMVAADGGLPDPDLRPAFRCALTVVGLGAATAGLIVSQGGTAIVLLGIAKDATALALGWNVSGCKEAWQGIRGRFGR